MSEKSLTLLELHLDDGRIQIGPRSLSTGRSTREDADGEADGVDVIDGPDGSGDGGNGNDGGDTGGSAARALLALLVVVTLALAAWKLLGGEDLEAVEELDELA